MSHLHESLPLEVPTYDPAVTNALAAKRQRTAYQRKQREHDARAAIAAMPPVAKEALRSRRSIRDVVLAEGLMTETQLDEAFSTGNLLGR